MNLRQSSAIACLVSLTAAPALAAALLVSSVETDNVLRFDALTGDFMDDFVAAGAGGLSGGRYFVFAPDSAVPEPSAAAAFALALAGLGFARLVRVVSAAPATGKTCASRSSAPATRS